jgi:hypothetical protein
VKLYIGCDNGVSGSIGILSQDGTLIFFGPTPTKSETSYTKTKLRMRTRINYPGLVRLFEQTQSRIWREFESGESKVIRPQFKVLIERPMINAMRFHASISAAAALEATLIALEACGLGYEYCDSKAWQKLLLPAGCHGPELKKASRDIGNRLYPTTQGIHTDCDGLLIAEYARRMNL